jgi:hypothetical protein
MPAAEREQVALAVGYMSLAQVSAQQSVRDERTREDAPPADAEPRTDRPGEDDEDDRETPSPIPTGRRACRTMESSRAA